MPGDGEFLQVDHPPDSVIRAGRRRYPNAGDFIVDVVLASV